jgi:hypothetical protein
MWWLSMQLCCWNVDWAAAMAGAKQMKRHGVGRGAFLCFLALKLGYVYGPPGMFSTYVENVPKPIVLRDWKIPYLDARLSIPVHGANSFFHLVAVGVVLRLACLAYLYYLYLLACLLAFNWFNNVEILWFTRRKISGFILGTYAVFL